MTTLRLNIIVLLLLAYCRTNAQICEDSVQSYSLYSIYKTEHEGSSFLKLQNGYNVNTAYVHTPSGKKLTIVLTDPDGQFVQSKFLDLADPSYILSIDNLIESPGNGIIAYGRLLTTAGNEKGVALIKFDAALSIQWSKLFRKTNAEPETSSYELWGLHCDEQSNIFFSFYRIQGGPVVAPNVFFVSLDISGNIVWSKGIDYRILPSPEFSFNAITHIDNKILFVGNYLLNNHPGFIGFSFSSSSGVFIKTSTGIIPTIGNLPLSSPHKQNIRLFPRQKDFYYAFGEETSSPNQSNLIHLLLDTSFNIVSSKKIKGLLWAVPWKQFYISRTGLIAFAGHDDPTAMNYKTDHFAVVDSAGNSLISKKVGDNLFIRPDLYPVIVNPDEKSISLSVGNYPVLDSLKRISIPLFGDTTLYSCLGKDTSFFTIEPVSFQKTNLNPGTIYSNVIESSLMPVLSSDFVMQKQEFCKVKSVCSTIKISGDSDFCQQTQQVFIVRKNQECLKSITWQIENIPADVVTKTDSSITIRFDNAWSGYLVAEINGCGLKDSLHIEAHKPLEAFSLGGDKILCPGDSVLLSAPQGYNNYEWNTGEDTNQIYAHHTGIYSVKVTDQCGNMFSSEILIKKPLYTIPFIRDEQICQGDSLFIFLSSHLSSYSWNPIVSPLNDSSFFIVPRENTSYTVTALDQNGCESKSNFNVVMQNCTNQVWVPNAFTPNRDGKNDSFGAYIDGRWQSFSLQVYNRWGQLVFNADEPLKKWDGKLNGSDCPTGVYIWVCKYRLLHANALTKKGTVVLIR